MKWDVIVVGGGASGLMAAGRAAELGARVLLLEKMNRAGLKLGLTGKGRCNITNAADLPSFIECYHHNGKFLYNAFSRFFHEDLIAFFNARGLPTVEERGRRIFPRSNRAQDVVRALQQYALGNGVALKLRIRVKEILAPEQQVRGVLTDQGSFEADRVVLATGGASYPETGSSGDGYAMAERLGHTIRPIRPSLVPLKVKESWVRNLQGLSLKNVKVRVLKEGQVAGEEFGEMLFTHFGVSGPIILSLSGLAVERMEKERLELAIDFKPALSREQVEKRLVGEIQKESRKFVRTILCRLLPQRIIPVFLHRAGISPELRGAEMPIRERRSLVDLLKNFRLTLQGARPLEEAIVTAGGVSVKEINPRTMESKIIQGLFFCGEVIDVDGMSGGYNLQAAFSTGRIAGETAAFHRGERRDRREK
jgi:predicted Rossmann fold flavoprotein